MEMTPTPPKVNGFPARFQCNELTRPAARPPWRSDRRGGDVAEVEIILRLEGFVII